MGNKNTCLFYKSANTTSDIPDVNLTSVFGSNSPNLFNVDQLTSSSYTSPEPSNNKVLTLDLNAISEALATNALESVTKSLGKNPALSEVEQKGGTIPNPNVPDVNIDGVMGRDGGKGSEGSTDGIHPGLIGGGIALAGGGLLIAYLEALKAKRRRRKERMRNMNTNIANV